MSLILNFLTERTPFDAPVGVPVTTMFTSLPFPGFITYLSPLTLLKPGAFADILFPGTPGIEIVIGLDKPRYTTFILSAATKASFGLGITA